MDIFTIFIPSPFRIGSRAPASPTDPAILDIDVAGGRSGGAADEPVPEEEGLLA